MGTMVETFVRTIVWAIVEPFVETFVETIIRLPSILVLHISRALSRALSRASHRVFAELGRVSTRWCLPTIRKTLARALLCDLLRARHRAQRYCPLLIYSYCKKVINYGGDWPNLTC